MHLPTVIKEVFLSEYPEYDNPQTKITVNINGRFDKNGGDIVLEMPHPKHPEYNTYVYYWFLMVDTESDEYKGNFIFEKEREYNVLRVDISLKTDIQERIYIRRKEVEDLDFNEREDLLLNKFKEEKDLEIRKWIAEKILSGEIELNYFVADSDSYECPPSRIKNRIIEL